MPELFTFSNRETVRTPDGDFLELVVVRTGVADVTTRGGGAEFGLVLIALELAGRWVRWLARGRPWTVRVEQSPSFDEVGRAPVVEYERDLDTRDGALEVARLCAAAIRAGEPMPGSTQLP